MEINDKKVVEILVAATLIVLLLILVFVVVGTQGSSKSTTSNVIISNSFNTVVNNENSVRDVRDSYGDAYYNDKYNSCTEETRALPFSSSKEHRVVTTVLGNNVDRYYVYVKNLGYEGGYFTVKFYFEDHYGEQDISSLTKYIEPKEQKSFIFQNVYEGKYQVTSWSYKVISESEENIRC